MTIVSPDRAWLTRLVATGGGGDIMERDRVRLALGRDLLASWDYRLEARVRARFWGQAAGLCPEEAPATRAALLYMARPVRAARQEPAQGALAAGSVPAPLAPSRDGLGEWLCSTFSLREADLAVCAAVCMLREERPGKALRKVKNEMVIALHRAGPAAEADGLGVNLAALFPYGEQWWL